METEDTTKQITELLSSIKSTDGNTTLLDHLEKMYKAKLELNDDLKYNDLFEDISIRIKQNGTYLNTEKHRENLLKYLEDFTKNIKKEKALLEPPMQNEPEGEPTPITSVNFVPDYHNLFKKLSWSGIGLSEKESYLLRNSLRNLSAKLAVGNVTFFGKIFGTKKDYYIAEATDIDPPAEFNYDPDMEHRKEDGVNRNVFYVTNDLTEQWTELPDVKPSQIITSRKIRYTFTGELNRQIYTNPHFNGQEQHLLRCQLARIYHGTKIVPTLNHFTVEDNENPFRALLENKENPKIFTHNDLINLKNWIHYPPSILKCGRVSHFIEPPEQEEGAPEIDPEEYAKKIKDADPFEKRIKSVLEDNQINTSSFSNIKINPWKISQCYEDNIYTNPYIKLLIGNPDYDPNDPAQQKDNTCDYSIICIKSLLWPGAYNFYLDKENYFFYFGNGLKFIDTEKDGAFVYNNFPIIPTDYKDLEDQPEPNFPPVEENPEGEEGKEENKEENAEGEEGD